MLPAPATFQDSPSRRSADTTSATSRATRLAVAASAVILAASTIGCAAMHPVKGVPADQLGGEYRGLERSLRDTLDLSLLGQARPPEHLVDAGDVVGVYIEGILGSCQCEQAIPVYSPAATDLPPSVGFPISVRNDGTMSLPLVPSIPVRGLTVAQVEHAIRHAYTVDKPLLQSGRERILVSLQKPRMHRIVVIRQESASGQGNTGASDELTGERQKRGTGKVVNLPAYRNDVLNALSESGGLPGLDARNTVYILRREPLAPCGVPLPAPLSPLPTPPGPMAGAAIQQTSGVDDDFGHSLPMESPGGVPVADVPWNANELAQHAAFDPTIRNPRVTKIPLRLAPGEPPAFGPADVVLQDGDVVFIESREPDFFYTGGLLGPGQFELPRDYDVNILDAIAIAEGRMTRRGYQTPPNKAIGGVSALNQDVTIGASRVIVQRTLPNGCLVDLEIDLHKALRDPMQRIVVRPNDRLILRYTCPEAVGAFFERHILEGFVLGASSSLLFGN